MIAASLMRSYYLRDAWMMNRDRVATKPEQLPLFASCGTDED
jgi:hypothetical protein